MTAVEEPMGIDCRKVLLVDDDPDDLDLYVELFREIDPDIAAVKCLDPIDALAYLRRSTQLPDLTILDYNMPRMTGLDFLRQVRVDARLGRLPVVVVTTGCAPGDAQALAALDAECHRKASSFDEFRALLQLLLSRLP